MHRGQQVSSDFDPGTDRAREVSAGRVVGTQNEGDMPHYYTTDLSTGDVVDETMGVTFNGSMQAVNVSSNNFDGLLVTNQSAASVSAFFHGTDELHLESPGNSFIHVDGFDGQDVNGQITFADGSVLKINNFGGSDTLKGGDSLKGLIESLGN